MQFIQTVNHVAAIASSLSCLQPLCSPASLVLQIVHFWHEGGDYEINALPYSFDVIVCMDKVFAVYLPRFWWFYKFVNIKHAADLVIYLVQLFSGFQFQLSEMLRIIKVLENYFSYQLKGITE